MAIKIQERVFTVCNTGNDEYILTRNTTPATYCNCHKVAPMAYSNPHPLTGAASPAPIPIYCTTLCTRAKLEYNEETQKYMFSQHCEAVPFSVEVTELINK